MDAVSDQTVQTQCTAVDPKTVDGHTSVCCQYVFERQMSGEHEHTRAAPCLKADLIRSRARYREQTVPSNPRPSFA
jgi:hypothetical protein